MDVLEGLKGYLAYELAPPEQAIIQLQTRGSLQHVTYLENCIRYWKTGDPFPKAWRTALQEDTGALLQEDREILSELSDTIGQCELESQLNQMDHIRQRLELQLEDARQKNQTYGKLYRTMGVLSGIFLVILFL